MNHLAAPKKTRENPELTFKKAREIKEKKNQKYTRRFNVLLITLIIGLFLSITISVMLGPVPIHAFTVWRIALSNLPLLDSVVTENWTTAQSNIIWEIRFPRVLLGAVVGAGLALVGVGIQALVRNSLADPYILGVSSGASVGATLVILFGAFSVFGQYALSLAAFLGALLSVVLVFSLAQVAGRISTIRLLLAGIAISMILSAITSFIVISTPREEGIRNALFWMMGSLVGAKWIYLPIPFIAVVLTFVFLLFQARSLNILLMEKKQLPRLE